MIIEDKAKAIPEWMDMTFRSWTYNALTDEQREKWRELQKKRWFRDAVKGTYQQRWDALNAIYFAFLEGAGLE